MASFICRGKPTKFDVDRCLVRFRKLQIGDIVPHEEMEKAIEEGRSTARYRTVLNRARKMFRGETGGVCLMSVRGVGYRYPLGQEQLQLGSDLVHRGCKSIKKGTAVTAAVADDRLDESGRKSRDFAVAKAMALAQFAREQSKKITMALAPNQIMPPMDGAPHDSTVA